MRRPEGLTEGQALGSPAVGAAVRAYCLSRPEVRVADLQRIYRLTFSEACRVLEELEALRLLGSEVDRGVRRWGAGLAVEPERSAAASEGVRVGQRRVRCSMLTCRPAATR